MLDPFTYGRLIGRKAAEPTSQDGVLREADETEDCRGGAKCSISLSDDEVMVPGLDFVGFEGRQANVSKKSNMDRFRDFYGIGPAAASKVLNDIQQIEGKRTRVKLQSFFLTLYYLKAYQTETVMLGWWKLNEKTIRAYVWKTLSLVHRLKEKKVPLTESIEEHTRQERNPPPMSICISPTGLQYLMNLASQFLRIDLFG